MNELVGPIFVGRTKIEKMGQTFRDGESLLILYKVILND